MDGSAGNQLLTFTRQANKNERTALSNGQGTFPMTHDPTSEKRPWKTSHIKWWDTTLDLALRKLMHAAGYRFRLHWDDLSGKSDIVLPKCKTAIFVIDYFCCSYRCRDSETLETTTILWATHLAENVRRDLSIQTLLKQLGLSLQVILEYKFTMQRR